MVAASISRVLAAQFLVTLLASAGIFYDWKLGMAMMLGALLCWVPNVLAACWLFQTRRAKGIRDEWRRMRRTWMLRWLVTLAGFGLVLGLWPEVSPLPLFAAYVATQAVALLGAVSH